MNRRMRTRGLMAGLMAGLALGCTGLASGQDDAPLGGPSVVVEADTPTLVERDYEGALRPIEGRAEVAAIALLGLSDAEREDVDALVLERAKLVDEIVFDNLELFTQLQSARSSLEEGARAGRRPGGDEREVVARFLDAVAPLREQEPLLDHYAAALPEAKREQYRAIVNEWTRASSEAAAGGTGERRAARMAGRRGPEMAGIRAELRAAYDRGVADRTGRLDSLIDRLELTPEQEGEVRAMIRAFGEANGREPTQAERADLLREILALLEPEQRREAIKRIREDRP